MKVLPYECGVEEEAVEVCRRLRVAGLMDEAGWLEEALKETEGLRASCRERDEAIASLEEEIRGFHEEIEWYEEKSGWRYPGVYGSVPSGPNS